MLNPQYQNIGIKGYFARYGLINGLRRGIFSANPLHIVRDYEIKKLLWQKHAAKTLRKYTKYCETEPDGLVYKHAPFPEEPVWVFWNTGFDTAPELVKACRRSLEKYCTQPVIALDESNVGEYVVFPESILKKVREKKIPIAIYSDLLRFSLLAQYGGTWIDSTVLLTAPLDKTIWESDFFAMRNSMGLIDNPALYAVWFLHSKAGGDMMRRIRNTAFAYWTRESHLIEYLTSNLIITELAAQAGLDSQIPYMNTDYSEYLIRCLADAYDQKKLDHILSLTGIHKLSYKLDSEIGKSDTMYRHLIESL